MKFKAKRKVDQEVELDVEFPLYIRYGDSFDSGGWIEKCYRITLAEHHVFQGQLFKEEEITEHDDHWEIQVNKITASSVGYMLNPENYSYRKASAKDYEDFYRRATAYLEGMK